MKDLSEIDTKRKRDFDDLQHEISGVDNGRMKRFLNATDERTPEGRRKKREGERSRQRLADMLLDPVYARLHHQLGNKLIMAEAEADSALETLERQLSEIGHALAAMEDRAARDPSGKLVFRYANGRVAYSDGSTVPDEILEGIIWPPHAPSAEDYFAVQAQRDQIEERLMEWESYRNEVLGSIRDTYDDEENPFQSPDDIQAALDQIESTRPPAPSVVVDHAATPETSTTTVNAFPHMPKT